MPLVFIECVLLRLYERLALQSVAFPKGADLTHLDALCDSQVSDSGNLDMCVELLIRLAPLIFHAVEACFWQSRFSHS